MRFFQELLQDLMYLLPVVINSDLFSKINQKEKLFQMKDNIIIKKFPSGITLHLDPEVPFETLLDDLAVKFSNSRQFFRDAKIALALEGRNFTVNEERQIINTIHLHSDLEIICIIGKNEETERNFVKAIQKVNEQYSNNYGHFYHGTLKNNQKIEMNSSIVILGDVSAGSIVSASKDIVILGGLYGEAHAGVGSKDTHYIAALEMSPEKIKIGGFRHKPKEKRWGFKPKVQPQIAYVKDNHIVMEPITKELLEFLPF